MNKSILSLLVRGGLVFSMLMVGQGVKAQGFSYPAEMNKRFTPLSIELGGISRLQVTVYNPNIFALTNASWTDNLSAIQPGILIADPANVSNTCGGSVTASPGGTTLSLRDGTVPAQSGPDTGMCTVSVDVTSFTPGNLINTIPAGALSSTGGGGTITNTTPSSATLHVDIVRAPTLSKSFAPNTMLVGQTSQLTIRIRNNDLDTALTQTSLTDELPANVRLADPVSPSLSGCGASASLSANAGGSSVTLNDSTISANSTCTIRVNVTSTDSGIHTNTIEAGGLTSNEGATNHDPTSDTIEVTSGSSGGGGDDDPAAPPAVVSGFLIPVTGFRPDAITPLDETTRPYYDAVALTIEIPVLRLNTSITGVQIRDGGWDVAWLQDQVGWLNGTAYPTRRGNSVLTAHVVNPHGKAGVFSRLKYLGVGEFIYLQSKGYRYIYQVVSNRVARPDDVNIFEHKDDSYITLVTCEAYDEATGAYLLRVAVRAVLVDVIAIK